MDQIDPFKGFVEYVNQTTAMDLGLYNYRNNKNWLYVDNTTIASSPGRKSVRIQSNNVYNQGLFVFDVSHIPWGCGTWPAIWTSGSNWPYSGEIAYDHGCNVVGGGVFAMEWKTTGIKVWNFPRTGIPSDVTSGNPDPTSWPTPQADFPLGANCPSTNFKNQYIILNTDFCG